ncbi:CD276 antigen homolog [Carassius carassius]|uniref:CD276 antigen homolog n=1 Tax=Carassius carassius TaxID=217509 RepID=UPI002868EC94|nr:CD276 antigen homolog [Carassius carassius]
MEIYKKISSGNLSRWSIFYFLSVFVIVNEVSLQEIVSVEGFIGGSAVLPCSSEEPLNTIQDIDLVRWRINKDQYVYDIIKSQVSVEEQDPQYRNRVESFPEEFKRGNFSIKLNDLQHTDAGEYQCYIFMKESVHKRVELSIKERPERQLPSEGTNPKPEMIVLFISLLCTGIIFSLTNSVTAGF